MLDRWSDDFSAVQGWRCWARRRVISGRGVELMRMDDDLVISFFFLFLYTMPFVSRHSHNLNRENASWELEPRVVCSILLQVQDCCIVGTPTESVKQTICYN